MPIYVYKCFHCGNEFEKLMYRATDEQLIRCAKCFNQAAKVPAVSAFAVNGYNAKNGYSK